MSPRRKRAGRNAIAGVKPGHMGACPFASGPPQGYERMLGEGERAELAAREVAREARAKAKREAARLEPYAPMARARVSRA